MAYAIDRALSVPAHPSAPSSVGAALICDLSRSGVALRGVRAWPPRGQSRRAAQPSGARPPRSAGLRVSVARAAVARFVVWAALSAAAVRAGVIQVARALAFAPALRFFGAR